MSKKAKTAAAEINQSSLSEAPDFSLKDNEGKLHSLSQQKDSYIVLFFYPKDNTPGCTLEAKEFNADLAKYKKRGVRLIGISGGNEKSKQKFCQAQDLGLLLLSDSDFEVAKAYQVFGEKKFMGRSYQGIFRTTFVIDRKKQVVKVFEKVKPEGHSAQVLEFLDSLK